MKSLLNRILFVFILILLGMGLFGAEPSQRDVVAMTILGEARGEGKAGMYAVACVISQRAINRNKTAKQICLQRKQFSCWNGGGKNLRALLNTPEATYAKMLATNINNLQRSYTGNADHYCTLNTYNYWTRGKAPIKVIGNHKFFKLRK
jgi:spore germination cell wall hydrolase CwlJ-like protein